MEISSKPQPEAILINRYDNSSKIVIEVKDLVNIYYSNKKKDGREKSKRVHYNEKFIERIAELVYQVIDKLLEVEQITLTEAISELIFKGLLVSVYRESEGFEINGKKIRLRSSSVRREVLSLSPMQEEELISDIVINVVSYLKHNIYACIEGKAKEFIDYHEFRIGKLNFMVGKSYFDSRFTFQYKDEPSDYTYNTPEIPQLESRVHEFYAHCIKKFSEYKSKEYKRVLLIINKNRYDKERIINMLKDIPPPECIDEVWLSYDIKEEVCKEKTEDFDREILVDIDYVKVFG
ncbi:hypothetical protein [Paenibacillus gansuensis]|uniref:Uncharacterized protein n=1 Tax=Paenibacillus gansuensis TaxID=306542 RepID=A0ABW5P8M8_9BACL